MPVLFIGYDAADLTKSLVNVALSKCFNAVVMYCISWNTVLQ